MAVHWNGNGGPNEFMSKQVVVLFIPCLIIFLHGFVYIISHNIYKFNEREHFIISGFIKRLLYLCCLSICSFSLLILEALYLFRQD